MLRILYVDDESDLLELGKMFLESEGAFRVNTVTSATAALPLLDQEEYDAVISDYQMPDMDGIAFLKAIRESGNAIPFILFTGRGREDVVIEAINAGVDFYLQKGGDPEAQFAELAHKIRQAARSISAEKSLQKSEERYRTIVNDLSEMIVRFDPGGTITFSNTAHTNYLLRWRGVDGCRGKNFREMVGAEKYETQLRSDTALLTPDRPYYSKEITEVWDDGTTHWYQWGLRAFFLPDGTVSEYQAVGHEITDLKVHEEHLRTAYEQLTASEEELRSQFDELVANQVALTESEEKFRSIFENSPYPIAINSLPDNKFLEVNKAFLDISGYSRDEILGHDPIGMGFLPIKEALTLISHRVRKGKIENVPLAVTAKGGKRVHVLFTTLPITIGGQQATITVTAEVTKLKRIEEELIQKNRDLHNAYETVTATEEELRSNYDELGRQEQALRESEEKYRLLTEMTGDVIYMIDAEGTLTHVSPQITRYGYTPEEVTSRHISEFVWEEDMERAMADMAKTLSTREPTVTLLRIRDTAGNLHWMEDNGAPVFSPSGAVIGITGVLRDVTKRIATEQALKESEEKFRFLVETSSNIIWERDLAGTFRYVSPRVKAILGYTPEELCRHSMPDLITDEGGRVIQKALAEVRATGKVPSFLEVPVRHRDGHEVILEIRPSFDDERKERNGLRGTAIDITERKNAENALRESEEKFRALVENTLEGVVITDFAGLLLFVNRAAGTILDCPDPTGLIGTKNVMEFVSPVSQESVRNDIAQVAQGNDAHLVRYQLMTATNRTIWVECLGKKTTFSGVPAMFVSMRDITDRKNAEEALRQANKNLSLLSGITRHDIKNQLMALNGFVALLRKKIAVPAFDNHFSHITKASRQIADLIQFTKDYESIGANTPGWQNSRALVETTATNTLPEKVTLKNDLPEDCEIYADPLIAKVLYNLMDNTLRHGGPVTTIRFSSREQDGTLVLVCEDDGNGVAASDKQQIFEFGFGKNTGIGLAISREILGITGITIAETGEPGKGARFEMTVPEGAWRRSGETGD